MVLVILVLVWIAVLLPPALRARAESRPADSISAFRRQLTTLRRTRPGMPSGGRGRYGDTVVRFQPNRSTRRPDGVGAARRPVRPSGPVRTTGPVRASGPVGVRAGSRTKAPRQSSRSVKRRRDIFVALVTASLATLVLGLFVPGLRFMLVANLLADVLLGAYVALLIRHRTLAAEREMKVRFLPRPHTVQPALTSLRRSVN